MQAQLLQKDPSFVYLQKKKKQYSVKASMMLQSVAFL